MTLRTNSLNLSTSRQQLPGFTIVELLIVIVVIGILATISIVAYNGIQQQARVSMAKTNLRSLGTTMQLYQAETGTYPNTDAELLDALGRQPESLRLGITNTGSIESDAPNSFMYCYSEDGSNMWIAAWKPVMTSTHPVPDGTPVYYWEGAGGLGEAEYNEIDGVAGLSLCVAASEDNYDIGVWSYHSSVQL